MVEKVAPPQGLDSPAKVLSSRFPDYPQSLRNANVVGSVIVWFDVDTDGSVSNPVVLGSPPPELAALTLRAIMQWKFSPATKNGVPVRVRTGQTFVFKAE
jgi:protein TonB